MNLERIAELNAQEIDAFLLAESISYNNSNGLSYRFIVATAQEYNDLITNGIFKVYDSELFSSIISLVKYNNK